MSALPPYHATSPVLARALVRWQHQAGPYWHLVSAPPFLVPRDPIPIFDSAHDLPAPVAEAITPEGSHALFLDLPLSETLPLAVLLNAAGFYVVPVMHRWDVESAIAPLGPILAHLMGLSRQLRRPRSPRGLAVLLDGERGGPKSEALWKGRTLLDNTHAFAPQDLPLPELLVSHGIRSAPWITVQDVSWDTAAYMERLIEKHVVPRVWRLPPPTSGAPRVAGASAR